MEFKGLEVTIFSNADRSDPTNQLLVVGAKAQVNGFPCGWKASVIRSDSFEKDAGLAIAHLIKQILTKPMNSLSDVTVPEPPTVTFKVNEVLVPND